jgi:hypothetical protein
VLPKRWIVERTLAWISHSRRLARDFERYARSAAAFIRLAMIRHHAPTIDQPNSLLLTPSLTSWIGSYGVPVLRNLLPPGVRLLGSVARVPDQEAVAQR